MRFSHFSSSPLRSSKSPSSLTCIVRRRRRRGKEEEETNPPRKPKGEYASPPLSFATDLHFILSLSSFLGGGARDPKKNRIEWGIHVRRGFLEFTLLDFFRGSFLFFREVPLRDVPRNWGGKDVGRSLHTGNFLAYVRFSDLFSLDHGSYEKTCGGNTAYARCPNLRTYYS